MFGTRIIGRRTYSWPEYHYPAYMSDRFYQDGRYYFTMKDIIQEPKRLSWKEEAKRPWLKPKPKAKEISSNLYKLLARAE
ncbi:hypothetical protein D3C85_270600 [compost metagenome]